MKLKITFLTLFALITALLHCQDNKTVILDGSWMGTISTEKFSLRVLLRFEDRKDRVKAYLDSPDQNLKDIPMSKVWTSDDSLFVEAANLNAGIIYKGRFLPGDSAIDGIWGGALPLRLSRTNYVFTLKTNSDPHVQGYRVIKLIESTPIKDQQLSNVCWSFATTSFIETEAIRLGKEPVILSPMYFVITATVDKAEKYIRMNGKSYFGPGDLTFSALSAYRQTGAVPRDVYPGKLDGERRYDHSDLDKALLDKVDNYVKSGRGKMTTQAYRSDVRDMITGTLGQPPDTFYYENKRYTPQTFAREKVGINPDNYVEITSFSHHPFYTKFILEIESNWNNGYYLNLPLADFSYVVDYALMHNYSVCWDGDAYRDKGFNDGFAVIRDTALTVTQEMRQAAFDNYMTVDQHNMHIIGMAENNEGKKFYIVKNSSDQMNCGGYLYMSKEYLLLRTISVMVSKDAIPGEIKGKFRQEI